MTTLNRDEELILQKIIDGTLFTDRNYSYWSCKDTLRDLHRYRMIRVGSGDISRAWPEIELTETGKHYFEDKETVNTTMSANNQPSVVLNQIIQTGKNNNANTGNIIKTTKFSAKLGSIFKKLI